MKLKKVIALLLAAIMVFSLAGCGSKKTDPTPAPAATDAPDDANKGDDVAPPADDAEVPNPGVGQKIIVWTLAEDLKGYADYYMEKFPGAEVETVIIAPADYPTKLTTALRGKADTPDVIVGEPQMLGNFFEAGFFEDLTQAPYNVNDYEGQIVDYVWNAGKDADGIQRALSYQVTPGGIFYRRDLAQEVFGSDDPATVSEKFKDYDTIFATAKELKAKGYRIFGDTGAMRWFAGDEAWVVDGKLNVSNSRMEYFEKAVDMYQQKLVAFSPEWSAAWYASMAGEIPMNAEWQQLDEIDKGSEKTQVFSYVMPSWGALTIRDNAKDNAGKFGAASAPVSFFGGGTFLGINAYSKKKDAAWEFVKFVTLNEDTAKWWRDKSKGDVASMISVLEDSKDLENEAYGNQKTYAFFADEANKIDYSKITKYDDQIGQFFGSAIESVQKGEKTQDEAMKEFYNSVRSVYPDIEVPK